MPGWLLGEWDNFDLGVKSLDKFNEVFAIIRHLDLIVRFRFLGNVSSAPPFVLGRLSICRLQNEISNITKHEEFNEKCPF